MKKDENILAHVLTNVQSIWRHRRGNEVPAAVQDTMTAIWGNEFDKPKPIITKTIKKPSGYDFILSLQPGLSYADFKKREPYFQDATGGAVVIEKRGKAIVMQIMTDELKSQYKYDFDYEQYKKMCLPVPFGYSAAGLVVRDLADAPNLMVAGHPGAGKSNFLHVLAASMLLSRPVQLVVIDLKRLEFAYLRKHALIITDMDDAVSVLESINRQLDKRLQLLEDAGVVKIQDYNGDMPFIVLTIDELAEMQDEDCQTMLNRIVRLGRAAGICVIAATQRPSSTLFAKFGDSKAMFAATMCFHVRDGVNSRMLLDTDRAALIPNIPGRAVYQWDRELEVQSMYLPVSQAKKLLGNNERMVSTFGDEQPPQVLPPRQGHNRNALGVGSTRH